MAVMVCVITSPAIVGLDTATVQVEVDLRPGLPAFAVVGLPDAAVQEARERVRSGIANQGYRVPPVRIVANLAPADLRKAGPQYDLPIALAILAGAEQLSPSAVAGVGAAGELALDGTLRPVAGTLAMAEHAARHGWRALVVPVQNAAEAAATARGSSRSKTSASCPPPGSSAATACASAASSRPWTRTAAPLRARACAQASPMPRVAPVTRMRGVRRVMEPPSFAGRGSAAREPRSSTPDKAGDRSIPPDPSKTRL